MGNAAARNSRIDSGRSKRRVAQRASTDPFENEERRPIGVTDLMDGQDVRMIQCGQRSGLASKPVPML